jgi:hypothetical protein
MYRDEPNIEVIPVQHDGFVYQHIQTTASPVNENYVIQVGFDNLWKNYQNPNEPFYSTSENFDVRFYEIMGLSFDMRWTLYKTDRDLEKEKNFFKSLDIKENEYIFVHDDDRFQIDMSKIDSNLKVVKPTPGLTSNIFNYCYLIENANQVHTIESSFGLMIDSLNLSSEHYLHRYIRPDNHPIYKNVKKILK